MLPDADDPTPQPAEHSRRRRVLRTAWRVAALPFRVLWRLLLIVAALLALVAVLAAGTVYYFLHDADNKLRNVATLTQPSKARLPQPIWIYSADGKLIGQVQVQQRIVISGRQIPDVARNATVAIEDQRFYDHHGVDIQGVMRAAWVNFRAKRTVQGASTISMQYIRNVYLNFEQTNARKIREMSLAWQLEGMWTKQRILDAYLNTVYYSNGRYGIEAASRYYFGVRARKLNAGQAALLAAIVKDPDAYDPRRHPRAARQRRDLVLDEMFAQSYLTRKQVTAAKRRGLRLKPAPKPERVDGYRQQLVDMVRAELKQAVSATDRARGGLRVTTSLDLADIQRARRTLADVYPQSGRRPLIAASFVDPRTGRVRVVASNRRGGYFNDAVQARRQPGSTVKAFTTATLLTEGAQLDDPVDNRPLTVRNGDSSYVLHPTHGAATIQDALRYSQNPAFWRLYEQAGPRRVLALQRRLGLTDMDANPAAALGGTRRGASTLQMASAYGTFAADGRYRAPHTIVRVEDRLGNTVHTDGAQAATQALAPEYARQTTAALHRVVSDGFAQLRASLTVAGDRPVAGKTGTTNNNADAWFVGYTPQLSGAVWTGYEKSQTPLRDVAGQAVYGASVPAQTWNELASQLLAGSPVARFTKPRGVQRVPQVSDLTVSEARQRLAQFGFDTVSTQAHFDPRGKDQTVREVTPKAGSWVNPGTPVTIDYVSTTQPMPQFVGRSYTDFVEDQERFFDFTVKLKPSDEPTGTIVGQSVAAGVAVSRGQQVTITVATQRAAPVEIKVPFVPSDSELAQLRRDLDEARGQVTVPDVIGLELDDAEMVLTSLGLHVQRQGEDLALRTIPGAGKRVRADSAVVVIGSRAG